MSEPMNPRTKYMLMNCAVAVTLVYKFWRGAPLAVILIVGLFMFTLVNVVMYFATRKLNPKPNR
jgi:hypothetical protein